MINLQWSKQLVTAFVVADVPGEKEKIQILAQGFRGITPLFLKIPKSFTI